MATEAQKRANKKFFADNWSQVKLSMPNEEAAALRQYCADHGLTVAGFIRGLVRAAISGESVQVAPVGDMDSSCGGLVTPKNNPEK